MKNIISGRVIKGDGFGKRLGFPTANLDRRQYSRDNLKLRLGVYAGIVFLPDNRSYRAGIVIGPIDRSGLPKLEAYLIGFKGNLYNKQLTVHLKKFLRSYQRFATIKLLQQQIQRDVQAINKLSL